MPDPSAVCVICDVGEHKTSIKSICLFCRTVPSQCQCLCVVASPLVPSATICLWHGVVARLALEQWPLCHTAPCLISKRQSQASAVHMSAFPCCLFLRREFCLLAVWGAGGAGLWRSQASLVKGIIINPFFVTGSSCQMSGLPLM